MHITTSTVNRCLAGLRRLFHFAIANGLMADSPFPKIPKSGLFYGEKRGLRNYFTQDQVVKIVETAPDWMKPMVLVSVYTGMRLGETLRLKWEHVNLDLGVINLPNSKTLKDPTGMGQRIIMQGELINVFKTIPKLSDWVFVRSDGQPYQGWHVHRPFKEILLSLGINHTKFSWKELRHTTGTLLHLKGVDVVAIKDQLRHTTVRTTENFYIGSDLDYQRAQVEKLSFSSKVTA